MLCENCGFKNNKGAKFCQQCGSTLDNGIGIILADSNKAPEEENIKLGKKIY